MGTATIPHLSLSLLTNCQSLYTFKVLVCLKKRHIHFHTQNRLGCCIPFNMSAELIISYRRSSLLLINHGTNISTKKVLS